MNLTQIFTRFPDHESCIEHLESQRWGDEPKCPLCDSPKVARKADGNRVGRWNCHGCKSSFNVLSGTLFSKTRIPLQKWFLAASLMINAKKSISSPQLARDLELNQKSAWFMQQRIRAEMRRSERGVLLQGIVETDETYVGGKPRTGNNKQPVQKNKRGRGTSKTPVIGAVERGGKVVARVASGLSAKSVLDFMEKSINPEGTLLITDEYPSYRNARTRYQHSVIQHAKQYVKGMIHVNAIESFWALVKRAWYGTHHHYSERYMPLFIAESCWKYNCRDHADPFSAFINGSVS